MKKISVVIPSYNEEKSVRLMYDRLNSVFRTHLPQYDYEIIFVDDYSTDGTRDAIRALAGEDKRVKAVFNARNFGFHRNVFSALTYGSGDATFMLFGDLQDPPENLPEFVARWEAGAKVVIGQRRSSDEGFIMTGCRHLYYKLIDWFADTPQIARFTGYGLYDVEFIDVLRQIGDIQPYFKTVVAEYGIGLEIVQYDQAQSSRGKSNFNFLRNYDFAMQGITSSTKLLMRMATFVATFVGIICLGLATLVPGKKLIELAGFRDPTVLQDKHAVKALHELGVDVVGDNDTSRGFHLLDGVDDLVTGAGIQGGSSLVEQQHLVVSQNTSCDADALFFTAGE